MAVDAKGAVVTLPALGFATDRTAGLGREWEAEEDGSSHHEGNEEFLEKSSSHVALHAQSRWAAATWKSSFGWSLQMDTICVVRLTIPWVSRG